ncbi:MAG: hypothetical protein JXA71_07370 [Chitinispirillaceae bacterium]|nr:hypothetical protein [Chitinispirillaceae bacterium]
MMTNDDVPRNMPYPQGRKPITPNSRYSSPSPSYNYNYNSNSSYPSQQHLRRKMDNRFKRDNRDNGNSNERLMRQNDLIIRLLKEIRDRLPPPPVSAPVNAETARQNRPAEEIERTEAAGVVPATQELQTPAPEAGNEAEAGNLAAAPVDEASPSEQQTLTEGNREAE